MPRGTRVLFLRGARLREYLLLLLPIYSHGPNYDRSRCPRGSDL